MKRFMRNIVKGLKFSSAIFLLLICVLCAISGIDCTILCLGGGASWKEPAVFTIIGFIAGTLCHAVAETI